MACVSLHVGMEIFICARDESAAASEGGKNVLKLQLCLGESSEV